jgi:hypothetical protein
MPANTWDWIKRSTFRKRDGYKERERERERRVFQRDKNAVRETDNKK